MLMRVLANYPVAQAFQPVRRNGSLRLPKFRLILLEALLAIAIITSTYEILRYAQDDKKAFRRGLIIIIGRLG